MRLRVVDGDVRTNDRPRWVDEEVSHVAPEGRRNGEPTRVDVIFDVAVRSMDEQYLRRDVPNDRSDPAEETPLVHDFEVVHEALVVHGASACRRTTRLFTA